MLFCMNILFKVNLGFTVLANLEVGEKLEARKTREENRKKVCDYNCPPVELLDTR